MKGRDMTLINVLEVLPYEAAIVKMLTNFKYFYGFYVLNTLFLHLE